MNVSNQEREQANSIIQKFIIGSSEDGLPPVNVILGMSATPDRFNSFLQGKGRTTRPCDIDPSDVRASGLIKDRIVLHPKETQPSPWTLLGEACRSYMSMCDEWAKYAAANSLPAVEPALIVQIEDGNSEITSRTDLNALVSTLEENIPGITPSQIVHCLQEDKVLEIGGRRIAYANPSGISLDSGIRVVLFKMALTTGWDCPRAEVMISFRRGQDATYIAQLVGRMVRTPLAERVHGNKQLNDVYLFLPYYDEKSVESIVDRLTRDRESVPAANVTTSKNAGVYPVNEIFRDVLPFLRGLATYHVSQKPKASNIRRLMKLTRLLSQDGIDTDAKEDSLSVIVDDMVKMMDKRLKADSHLRERIEHLKTVTYRTVILRAGELTVVPGDARTVPATERDIETLFSRAKSLLTEDVAMAFWRVRHQEQEPLRAKVETYEIAGDEIAWREIDGKAGTLLNDLLRKHQPSIVELAPERRSKHEEIAATARNAESTMLDLPEKITVDVPAGAEELSSHLYINERGSFRATLNDWERTVLDEELSRADFLCWLRNFDRKPWSMSYVYNMAGEERPGYPDFIIVRKHGTSFVADILEPHRGDDSVPKAKGLARYAEKHRMQVGRVEMIRKDGAKLKRLDFTDTRIRQQIAAIQTPEELDHLFDAQPS